MGLLGLVLLTVVLELVTLVGQRESRASKQGKGHRGEGRELLHASPEFQDFLLKFRYPQVRHVQAHHDRRGLAEPPTGRRARDPRSVAMVTSSVRWTRSRSRWS